MTYAVRISLCFQKRKEALVRAKASESQRKPEGVSHQILTDRPWTRQFGLDKAFEIDEFLVSQTRFGSLATRLSGFAG
jgi:hypothetical protein